MPVYEYVCAACGQAFEQLIRSKADERKLTCPKCGGKHIERQLSVIATPRAAAAKPTPGPCGACENSGSCPYK